MNVTIKYLCGIFFDTFHYRTNTKLKLTEIEEGLPLVSLSGQLVCTHELLKLSLRHVFQDVLRTGERMQHQCLGSLTIMPHGPNINQNPVNKRATKQVRPVRPSRVCS